MAEVFGLDFGTTNSLTAVVVNDEPIVVGEGGRPVPSVVQYHGADTVVGERAKRQLTEHKLGVIGSIVRAPKRYLGGQDVRVGGVSRAPSDIVADILAHLRNAASSERPELPFDRAVATIPVTLDGTGRRDLRAAARKAGIEVVQFVHEPLAALYGYLRAQPDFRRRVADLEGKLVLVFDWGGGTLDLTLCRVQRGTLLQILNEGDDGVGGDKFDEVVRRHVAHRHLEIHSLDEADHVPAVDGAREKLLAQCENAKIDLSTREQSTVFVGNYLLTDRDAATLEVSLTVGELEDLTRHLVEAGLAAIGRLLDAAEITAADVSLCLATGGMVTMPTIRRRLIERFDLERVPKLTNGQSVIAEGAAWLAADRRPLTLAKPFELLHADDSYISLIDAGTSLPSLGYQQTYEFSYYCTDPRDGFARFLFARPVVIGARRSADREPYVCLLCAVDPNAAPLAERLEVHVRLDQDLVVTTQARSSLVGDCREAEIHDLEFGVSLRATGQ